ncbi:unnamed protein product, partial [Discosporangium mesarthrocarpum]
NDTTPLAPNNPHTGTSVHQGGSHQENMQKKMGAGGGEAWDQGITFVPCSQLSPGARALLHPAPAYPGGTGGRVAVSVAEPHTFSLSMDDCSLWLEGRVEGDGQVCISSRGNGSGGYGEASHSPGAGEEEEEEGEEKVLVRISKGVDPACSSGGNGSAGGQLGHEAMYSVFLPESGEEGRLEVAAVRVKTHLAAPREIAAFIVPGGCGELGNSGAIPAWYSGPSGGDNN